MIRMFLASMFAKNFLPQKPLASGAAQVEPSTGSDQTLCSHFAAWATWMLILESDRRVKRVGLRKMWSLDTQ